MIIINNETSSFSDTVLVLGFFDGIHLGHNSVISSAVKYAYEHNLKSVLLTFKTSPAEYFNKNAEYIYSRSDNYELISNLGVDYLYEEDFADIVTVSADEYIKSLIKKYQPKAIFTGYNYTFGCNKAGNKDTLYKYQEIHGYEYFKIDEYKIDGITVSSTNIKKELKTGNIEIANRLLGRPYTLKSSVIRGKQLGRNIGFPTANMIYPKNIVKIPYGVYCAKIFDKPAVLNWGVKPTLGTNSEILELHIPDFNGNLYGQVLKFELIKKIRDEQKFDSIDELKVQIKKDTEECLKL